MKLLVLMLGIVWSDMAASQVQPGNWELTVVTQMADAGKPTAPLQKTQCFTEADANDPSRILGSGGTCQFSNRREVGDTLSFDLKCSGPLPLAGTGSLRYGNDAFTGQLDEPGEPRVGRVLQVLLVQPRELLGIELRRRARDVLQIEPPDEPVLREYFIVAMGPAQSRQVVQQRFRQIPLVAILRDAHRAVALREPLAVGAEDHRDMGKLR